MYQGTASILLQKPSPILSGESWVYLDYDKFSEDDCAVLKFYEQGTRFFVKVKIDNRELDALLDSGSTKFILGKKGMESAVKFNQEIKPSKLKLFYSRMVA